MKPIDFLNNVVAQPELTALGGREATTPDEDDLVFIRHEARHAVIALPVGEVVGHSWQELEAFLTGKRRGDLMGHMARIVGYYSWVRNWNRSKLAELRDRHRGDYALPADPKAFTTSMPERGYGGKPCPTAGRN